MLKAGMQHLREGSEAREKIEARSHLQGLLGQDRRTLEVEESLS